MSGMVGADALKFARYVWNLMVNGKGYERILTQVEIVSAGEGSCVAEFKVQEGMVNKLGTIHGGCVATLMDCISSIGQMTGTNPNPSVSINLSISYLRSAAEGETLVLDAKTVKVGKTLAFLEAVLKNKENGNVVATGTHLKFFPEQKDTKSKIEVKDL